MDKPAKAVDAERYEMSQKEMDDFIAVLKSDFDDETAVEPPTASSLLLWGVTVKAHYDTICDLISAQYGRSRLNIEIDQKSGFGIQLPVGLDALSPELKSALKEADLSYVLEWKVTDTKFSGMEVFDRTRNHCHKITWMPGGPEPRPDFSCVSQLAKEIQEVGLQIVATLSELNALTSTDGPVQKYITQMQAVTDNAVTYTVFPHE
jgi:hypothetical protein